MLVKIINELTDTDFLNMENAPDREITFDLSEIKFLSSHTITRMLLLANKGKCLILSQPNEHIRETISILNLENTLKIQA
jgi:anti-anti-sigma regulatory factor